MNEKQGAKIIERIKNRPVPGPVFDCRKARIEDMVFESMDLSNIDFSLAVLRNCRFVKCSFSGTIFRGADLGRSLFRECKFKASSFEFAEMRSVSMEKCVMDNGVMNDAVCKEARVLDVTMRGVLAEGVDLSSAEIKDCLFAEVKFCRGRFQDALFKKSVFQGSDFTGSVLSGIFCVQTDFIKSVFNSADLSGAALKNTVFEECSLFRSNFTAAYPLKRVLEDEILSKGGRVSPHYLRMIWANGYSRAALITGMIVFAAGAANFLLNPEFWSLDEILRRSDKAMQMKNYSRAEKILRSALRAKKNDSPYPKGKICLMLGDLYRHKGDNPMAKEYYSAAIGSNEVRDAVDAKLRIADLDYSESKNYEILDSYIKIAEEAKDDEQQCMALVHAGDVCRDNGDIEKARKFYDKARLKSKGRPEIDVIFRLVELARMQNKNEEGIALCRQIIAETKEKDLYCWALIQLGEIYRDTGRSDQAAAMFSEARDKGEGRLLVDALFRLKELAYSENNVDEAMRLCLHIISKAQDPDQRFWALMQLGDIYRDQGELLKARKTYAEAANKGEKYDSVHALFKLAELSSQENKTDEAVAIYLDIMKKTKDQEQLSGVLVRLGDIYRQKGDVPKAKAMYEKASAADNGRASCDALFRLAALARDENKPDVELGIYEQISSKAQEPDQRYGALIRIGDIYLDKGDKPGAKKLYTEARDKMTGRGQIDAMFRLIELARKENKFDEAEALCEAIISKAHDPDQRCWALITLGDVFRERKDFGQAAKFYTEAREKGNSDSSFMAIIRLAELALEMNKPGRALEFYKEASGKAANDDQRRRVSEEMARIRE